MRKPNGNPAISRGDPTRTTKPAEPRVHLRILIYDASTDFHRRRTERTELATVQPERDFMTPAASDASLRRPFLWHPCPPIDCILSDLHAALRAAFYCLWVYKRERPIRLRPVRQKRTGAGSLLTSLIVVRALRLLSDRCFFEEGRVRSLRRRR